MNAAKACSNQFPHEYGPILAKCFHRAGGWRVPPNWSPSDWSEEIRAIGFASVCHATSDYDATRGVPLGFFLYSRIMASTLKRYRQEWTYALRHVHILDEAYDDILVAAQTQDKSTTVSVRRDWPTQEEMSSFLAQLSESDSRLMQELFWEDSTETEIAQQLGISQQAVSKRKKKILRALRCCMENRKKKEVGGCKI